MRLQSIPSFLATTDPKESVIGSSESKQSPPSSPPSVTAPTTTLTNDYRNVAEWTIEHENILIEWADKAMCFRWLHSEAFAYYSFQNSCFTLPVIIISAVTGTANLAQAQVPIMYQSLFLNGIGIFNIIASIVTIIQQYYKITQLAESHRASIITWDKFHRNIKLEISRCPEERYPVNQMLKLCKEEFDRFTETSPMIPKFIIKKFKTKFADAPDFESIHKPEICDYLVSVEKGRNPWATPERIAERMHKRSQMLSQHKATVRTFIRDFSSLNGRIPFSDEIVANLKDAMTEHELDIALLEIKQEDYQFQSP
jgi:hypothetical protein